MESRDKVSIIIPCYNQGHFLSEAIQSVINQSYPFWECIIVNDGSTDATKEIAQRYVDLDPRIRYVEQSNTGLSGARNRGLREAAGRYIQFLDCDDLMMPEKIALQVSLLQSSTALSLAYCDFFYCKGEDVTNLISWPICEPRLVMERPLWDLASRWETALIIPPHGFLFDARFFKDKRIEFDENLPTRAAWDCWEDWDCWMRIFSFDPIIHHVEQKLVIYRIHGESKCANRRGIWRGYRRAIQKQERLFRHDPVMSLMLRGKMNQMRRVARKRWTEDLVKRVPPTAARAFKRYTPWPLQKMIYKFADLDIGT